MVHASNAALSTIFSSLYVNREGLRADRDRKRVLFESEREFVDELSCRSATYLCCLAIASPFDHFRINEAMLLLHLRQRTTCSKYKHRKSIVLRFFLFLNYTLIYSRRNVRCFK